MKLPITFKTAFADFTATESLGEGGAGKVFGGVDEVGNRVAIKVLTQTSSDKRRRFKNEIAFLQRVKHENVVGILDYGVHFEVDVGRPFYVMPRFPCSMRRFLAEARDPALSLAVFVRILDGVEAAHLLGAVHRDLKPENILFDPERQLPAIADFGIANFTEELLLTDVKTGPAQRLANFQYAAPEQRSPGGRVTLKADIYALGLILNEVFTGAVPHGTEFKLIRSVSEAFGFLDDVVAAMIRQSPGERPASIAHVKELIERHRADLISRQRLSQFQEAVVRVDDVDAPLAHAAPVIVGGSWDNGILRMKLDRDVTADWVRALHEMGNYTSVLGVEPYRFQFSGRDVTVQVPEHSAQQAIDHFKQWLPQATLELRHRLQARAEQVAARRRQELRLMREEEERKIRVNSSLRF